MQLILLVFATFWAWETLRYVLERLPSVRGVDVFSATRAVHPLVVAALPLGVLWPDWVAALAVAGVTGLLVAVVDRYLGSATPVEIPVPRSRGGLPPLP